MTSEGWSITKPERRDRLKPNKLELTSILVDVTRERSLRLSRTAVRVTQIRAPTQWRGRDAGAEQANKAAPLACRVAGGGRHWR